MSTTGDPVVYAPEWPEWRRDAACLGAGPNAFYPERGEDVLAAKAVCAECPVKQDCLDYALETRQLFGIWGGLSERQRRALRPRRRTNGQVVEEAS